ncbi:MAG: hypothetical protein HQ546_02300, partial [Planctomycetes bacterium]|nr:hypothetical protein [Planctomycetota bacterium]
MNEALVEQIRKRVKDKVNAQTVPVRKTAPEDVRVEVVKERPLSIAKYMRGAMRGNWNEAPAEKAAFVSVNKVMIESVGT